MAGSKAVRVYSLLENFTLQRPTSCILPHSTVTYWAIIGQLPPILQFHWQLGELMFVILTTFAFLQMTITSSHTVPYGNM